MVPWHGAPWHAGHGMLMHDSWCGWRRSMQHGFTCTHLSFVQHGSGCDQQDSGHSHGPPAATGDSASDQHYKRQQQHLQQHQHGVTCEPSDLTVHAMHLPVAPHRPQACCNCSNYSIPHPQLLNLSSSRLTLTSPPVPGCPSAPAQPTCCHHRSRPGHSSWCGRGPQLAGPDVRFDRGQSVDP